MTELIKLIANTWRQVKLEQCKPGFLQPDFLKAFRAFRLTVSLFSLDQNTTHFAKYIQATLNNRRLPYAELEGVPLVLIKVLIGGFAIHDISAFTGST